MTFDSALSQHAFSLAVATDAEHGGKKAANVVLDEVRRTFGAHTMIAPTGVAANGEHVVPIKRLSPEQVKQVKTQILMAKAEAAAASTAAMTAGRARGRTGEPRGSRWRGALRIRRTRASRSPVAPGRIVARLQRGVAGR